MIRYISHPQDLHDACVELKDLKRPFKLQVITQKPTGGSEKERWNRQNSFFHRGIVPTFSKLSGLGENEAKEELQKMFACVIEEQDHYQVESIGGMSNSRLSEFIEQCTQFLVMNYGEAANEMLINNINKTKKIKK